MEMNANKLQDQDWKLSILLLSFLQILIVICLSTRNLGCEGVKLIVNNVPPAPPYVTSLYKAPQTYYRKKPPGKPFILISKLRPCHHFHDGKHLARKKTENSTTMTTAAITIISTSLPTTGSSPNNTTISPSLANSFVGHWQITKPKLKDEDTANVIKYNPDGTRIFPETIYKYHTRQPQLWPKDKYKNKLADDWHTKGTATTPTDNLQRFQQQHTNALNVTNSSTNEVQTTTTSNRHSLNGKVMMAILPNSLAPYKNAHHHPVTLTPTSVNKSLESIKVQQTETTPPVPLLSFTNSTVSTTPSVSREITTLGSRSPTESTDTLPETTTESIRNSIIKNFGGSAKTILSQLFKRILDSRKTNLNNRLGYLEATTNQIPQSHQREPDWTTETSSPTFQISTTPQNSSLQQMQDLKDDTKNNLFSTLLSKLLSTLSAKTPSEIPALPKDDLYHVISEVLPEDHLLHLNTYNLSINEDSSSPSNQSNLTPLAFSEKDQYFTSDLLKEGQHIFSCQDCNNTSSLNEKTSPERIEINDMPQSFTSGWRPLKRVTLPNLPRFSSSPVRFDPWSRISVTDIPQPQVMAGHFQSFQRLPEISKKTESNMSSIPAGSTAGRNHSDHYAGHDEKEYGVTTYRPSTANGLSPVNWLFGVPKSQPQQAPLVDIQSPFSSPKHNNRGTSIEHETQIIEDHLSFSNTLRLENRNLEDHSIHYDNSTFWEANLRNSTLVPSNESEATFTNVKQGNLMTENHVDPHNLTATNLIKTISNIYNKFKFGVPLPFNFVHPLLLKT